MLLERLRSLFGVSGQALQWISSYLHERNQTVVVEGVKSAPTLLEYGVPQGSVLGPKFYTL